MAINLSKGQRINLEKEDGTELTRIRLGLGWSASTNGPNMDLDSSVMLLGSNDKLIETISFRNLNSRDGAVKHHNDDVTGGGRPGDPNEIIDVNLSKLNSKVEKLIFIMNIYSCRSRGQNFGMLNDEFIVITDMDTNKELARFKLNTKDNEYNTKTAIYIGEIYRNNGKFKFNSLGKATNDFSITDMERNYTNTSSQSSTPNTGTTERSGGFFSRLFS